LKSKITNHQLLDDDMTKRDFNVARDYKYGITNSTLHMTWGSHFLDEPVAFQ